MYYDLGQHHALHAYGLTKEAASLKEWLAMLLAGSMSIGTGAGIGKLKVDARGMKNIPAYINAKAKGQPFNPPHCDDCAKVRLPPSPNIAELPVPKNLT